MKYKTAIIGCGAISAKHLKACIDNNDATKLVALCDIDDARAKALAGEYAAATGQAPPRVFKDYRGMLSEIHPDIAAVATSSKSHYPIAIDCLNTDAHLILEKPIALSISEADEIVETAAKRNRKLAVCFITRFAPHVQAVYRAVSEGKLGKMLHGAIQLRWNRGDDYFRSAPWRGTWEHDGGMLMNQATHGIDLLLWLMGGEISSVYAVGRRFQRPIESEDFAGGLLQFKDGSVAVVEATINSYPSNLTQSLSLFGSTGTVVLDGTHMGEVSTWRIAGEDEEEAGARLEKGESKLQGHSALYRDFFDAIAAEREPLVNGREGLRSLKAILAFYKSMREKKEVAPPAVFATKDMEGIWNS